MVLFACWLVGWLIVTQWLSSGRWKRAVGFLFQLLPGTVLGTASDTMNLPHR